MTEEEIKKRIYELKSDGEAIEFVKERLQKLENEAQEIVVGQDYTDSFKSFIANKVHYKPASTFKGFDCPDLMYDDINPYVDLINYLKRTDGYNEYILFILIYYVVNDYLLSNGDIYKRFLVYDENQNKRVSIRKIKEEKCACCSEIAGLTHNLFKFLGIDSEMVFGYRNTTRHAFNIIYPKGYGNEPMILYDSTFFVIFKKSNEKEKLGYFKVLSKEKYRKLIEETTFKIDLKTTEEYYRKLFRLGDEYVFLGEEASYHIGLDKERLNKL